MSCDHDNLNLFQDIRHVAHKGDRGLPRQLTLQARCRRCGEKLDIDYNIAFIDGESA
jgi:hypothetical protein